MKSALDLALELHSQGLAAIPILEGTKQPAVRWKQFQRQAPSTEELYSLFAREHLTVGVLCGKPSDRLLVLDCDNFKTLDQTISTLGNPHTWIVQSKRGGHVYLRTPVPVRSARAEGMDLKGQGGYVLAPGALHPTGIRYTWLNHSDTIYDLDALDAIPGIHLEPAPLRPSGMPRRAWLLLTDPATAKPNGAPYSSASEREFAVLCTLINSGWDWNQIFPAFNRYATHGHYTRKVSELGATRAATWLEKDYHRALQFVRANESEERRAARSLQQWAINVQWNGRTGAHNQVVFLAHAKIAERVGHLTYGASVRELAELAGVSKNAASRANHRLLNDPRRLLSIQHEATASLSTRWALDTTHAQNLYTPSPLGGYDCIQSARHDAFRWKGLGKSGAQIYELLHQGQPLTAEEIANTTGRHVGTVRRNLNKLKTFGLVQEHGAASKWTAQVVDLNGVAHVLETSGTGARQKQMHALERQRHAQELRQGGAK